VRVLDLFSGIGGFSLGLEKAGMETVAFCENDAKCRQVLTKHWPTVPQFEDVKTLSKEVLDEKGITDIGLICGGFPCQGFSIAGQRKGEADDRYLWPEYFRLIQEIRPDWVIGENVAGIINLGLDTVLADLEGENYSVQTFVIPACAVNAPHRRDRVWIVAHTNQNSEPTMDEQRLSVGDTEHDGLPASEIARGFGQTEARPTQGSIKTVESEGAGRPSDHGAMVVADTIIKGSQGRLLGGQNQERQSEYGHTGRCSSAHGQPGPDIWDVEPDVGRVAHGVPRRVDRLRQLGNAVVPQIPEIIGKAIMEIAA